MLENHGVLVDFRDIVSIDDPVVRSVLEGSLVSALGKAAFRQFRLTPRVMILLFDEPAVAPVLGAVKRLQRELDGSHCGHLEWKAYDLAVGLSEFRADCHAITETSRAGDHDESGFKSDGDHLGTLLHVIDALRTIDLSAHIRQQHAIRIDGDRRRKIEFQERWVDLAELELSIGLPIRNSSWKFAHVTEFLDFKVLDQLTRDWHRDSPISLNLRVVNVLTDTFEDILIRIPAAKRDNLIVELSVSEFLHDRDRALAATLKLHASGVRVAIDGIALPILDQVKGLFPRFNYVKMPWNDALTRLSIDQKARFKAVIDAQSSGTFVLTRCSRPEHVETGTSLGFTLFQGWAVTPEGVAKPNKLKATPPKHAKRPVDA